MEDGSTIQLDELETIDFTNILKKINDLTKFSQSEKELILTLKSQFSGWMD